MDKNGKLFKMYSVLCGKTSRTVLPFALMILVVVVSSSSFYSIQLYGHFDNKTKHYRIYQRGGCVDTSTNASLVKSFYFVATVCSSIGYGDVVPCTWPGKLLTVITALIGVPLTLFCLGKLGQYMSEAGGWLWRRSRRNTIDGRQRLKSALPSVHGKPSRKYTTGGAPHESSHDRLPLIVVVLATAVWTAVSAVFFYFVSFKRSLLSDDEEDTYQTSPYIQENWTYLDAIYFAVISLFTIGFGEYHPTNRVFDVATFSIIFVGLAMVSMCVAVATKRVETQLDRAVRMIQKVYDQQCNNIKRNTTGEPVIPIELLIPPELLNDDESQAAQLVLTLWNRDPNGDWLKPLLHDAVKAARCPSRIWIGNHATRLIIDKWKRKTFRRQGQCQTALIAADSTELLTETPASELSHGDDAGPGAPVTPPPPHRRFHSSPSAGRETKRGATATFRAKPASAGPGVDASTGAPEYEYGSVHISTRHRSAPQTTSTIVATIDEDLADWVI